MGASRFRYYLNVRAALILTAFGLVAALGLRLLWVYQEKQTLRDAMRQIESFREASAEAEDSAQRSRNYDLALRHLNQYLAYRRDDPDALEIQAKLLAEDPSNLQSAARVYEHLLRVAPGGSRGQEARRRLAGLYILMSDLYRQDPSTRLIPEETSKHLQYYTAELYLDQLLDPKARPRVDDAEAHRLRAMAFEGQILPGRTTAVRNVAGRQVEVDLLQPAIDEYEIALRRDPGDLLSAQRLAQLYLIYKKDNATARRVIDGLLVARPDDLNVRLARYQFFKSIGDGQAATDEIEAAVKLAPKNLPVILTAASDALRTGGRDTARARQWIGTIPEENRDDPEVLKMRGIIEWADGHIEDAIDLWREGLTRSGGSDKELCWRLSSVLLELGRDQEAGILISQYRRLVDKDTPALWLLEAIQEEHAGRYFRAIPLLQSARDRLPQELQEAVRLVLGRCQAKQKDWIEAEKTYREALQLIPQSASLRRALCQLLLSTRPPEADEEIEREIKDGLAKVPDDPSLLVILAQARLQKQLNRTPERRNWAEFDEAFARAAEMSPDNPLLSLMRAERLAKDGGLENGVAFLREAARKAPKSAEIAIALAEGLAQEGHRDEALKILEQASAPDAAGDRGALRIQRARLLVALGRGREARDLLVRDAGRLPETDRSLVWKTLAQICSAQGDLDATRDAYADWARSMPGDREPRLALLEMAIDAGDKPAIRAQLEALRPRDSEGDLAWRLAQIRERLWRRTLTDATDQDRDALLKEAKAMVESVLRDDKVNPVALFLQGQIYEAEGDWEKAVDSYTRSQAHGHPSALPRLVALLTQHGRKDDLAKLRQSDSKSQVDQLETMTFLQHGNKEEAAKVIEQSLQEPSQPRFWQAGMLDLLGTGEKAEAALRQMAEKQPGSLEPWLALLRFQAAHNRSDAIEATIAHIKQSIKSDRPELLEAECRWAAADRAAADTAFASALERYAGDREVEQAALLYYEETAQHDRAEASLRKILDRSPNDRGAARLLAIVLSARTDRPGAWEEASEILGPENSADQTPEERVARAIVLARGPDAAQREQAVGRLEDLVADLPAANNIAIAARDLLVRLLLASGKPERAAQIAAVTANMGSNPNAIALHIEALLESKQFDAAESQINRLAAIPNGSEYEANFRARLVQERSQPNEAAVALERAYLEREKTSGAEAFGRAAFRLLLEMGPGALDVAESLGRRLALHDPGLSWMPAQVLARKGDPAAAIALCQSAAQAQARLYDLKECARVILEVAVASRSDDATLAKADAVLVAALRQAPDADDLLVMKAMLNHLQRQYEEEVRLYRIVLEHQPRNDLVLNNIAYALSEGLKQPSEALEFINRLIRLAGPNAEYLDTRGMILIRLRQFDEAIKDLEESAHSRPDGNHLFHLALAYQAAGRIDKSQAAFEKARKVGLTAPMVDPGERAAFASLSNH